MMAALMRPWAGLRIVSSPYAVTHRVEHKVVRLPIPKRRKRYRVVRREWTEPGVIRLADGTILMHPDIYAKLPHSTPVRPGIVGKRAVGVIVDELTP